MSALVFIENSMHVSVMAFFLRARWHKDTQVITDTRQLVSMEHCEIVITGELLSLAWQTK